MSGQRTGQRVPVDRRSELIIELLRLSADPLGAAAAWEGVRGSGQAPPIRPHESHCPLVESADKDPSAVPRAMRCTCWLRSLDELHRCLRLMRKTQRPLWYAVYERYIAATRKPTLVTVKHGRPQLEPNQTAVSLVNRTDLNKRGDGTTRLIVESWRSGLDQDRIGMGVVWLAAHFQGQPELPLDLLHAA